MEEQTQLIVAAILAIASLGAVKDALPSEVVRRYREDAAARDWRAGSARRRRAGRC